MSSNFNGWSNLPKSVKILDISIIGYLLSLLLAILLYFISLDRTVQNLMPIFLSALILLFTWNFRVKILTSTEEDVIKHYYREWLIICGATIVIIILLILIYPVTY
ncbi:MAG: hypothetical protein ACXACP_07215 [Candidatus Hodarchaeales archaeon]|jgi:hypothetical protein